MVFFFFFCDRVSALFLLDVVAFRCVLLHS